MLVPLLPKSVGYRGRRQPSELIQIGTFTGFRFLLKLREDGGRILRSLKNFGDENCQSGHGFRLRFAAGDGAALLILATVALRIY